MNENMMLLSKFSKEMGIELTEEQLRKFEVYMDYLLEYNQHTNLTAVTEPSQIVIKHFLDSMIFTKAVSLKENDRIIDVGTGAGFPGVPIKIAVPSVKLSLLDSLNKRVVFLQKLTEKLEIDADIMHKRAEEGAVDDRLREKFDYCVSRAVASLNVLAEYCLPYVKPGGYFVALKGPSVDEEIKNAKNAIKILGGGETSIRYFELPDKSGDRSIVLVKKLTSTDKKYPRQSTKIAKKPL